MLNVLALGTSLMAQWLRIHLAEDAGSILGWGAKIPHAIEQLGP